MRISISKATKLPVTKEMVRQAIDIKGAGTIEMKCADFLRLTTTSQTEYNAIMAEALPLQTYIDFAKSGNNIHMPHLKVSVAGMENTPVGKVLSHEGRHRAAAVLNAGGLTMRVLLIALYNGSPQYRRNISETGFKYRYVGREDFPGTLQGQFRSVTVNIDLTTFESLNK